MSEVNCEHFFYPSADAHNTVAGYLYTVPGVPVRAVVQLCHGMCEHIGRYAEMAAYLAAHGIAAAGNDHLGHGHTARREDLGHYGEKNGRWNLLADMKTLNDTLHSRFPGVPVVLFGHSMGSFFARWYAEVWPESIDALILCGTGGPQAINTLGTWTAAAAAAVCGEHTVIPLLSAVQMGSYNDRIPNASCPSAWLTRDEKRLQKLNEDPLGNFLFTAGSYREMGKTVCHVSTRAWASHIPASLPVLLIAGTADPVGQYGLGVLRVYRMLREAGVKNIRCRLWRGDRHELHNELDREEIFAYVRRWMERLF